MKKYFSILLVSGFVLASCGGNASAPKEGTPTDSTDVTITTDTAVVATVDPAQVLADYKDYVEKFEKVAVGVNKKDGNAMIEYSKLLKQDAEIRSSIQKASAQFTEDQVKEYKKLVEKYTASVKLITPEK